MLAILAHGFAAFAADAGHVLAILADAFAAFFADGGHVLAILGDALAAALADGGHVFAVDRGGESIQLSVALPARWWWTDLRFRQSSVEPRTYFEDRPVTDADKRKLGLKPEGFASEVKYVAEFARTMKTHDLRVGDIIVGVDGVESDELANTADLYIKLKKAPGESVTLDVIRGGSRMRMPLKTYRMSFRK